MRRASPTAGGRSDAVTAAWRMSITKECIICGSLFHPLRESQRFCRKSCARRGDDRRTVDPKSRLIDLLEVQPNGCWNWVSHISKFGYGTFWMDGSTRSAHRTSYRLFRGEIPDGLTIDHLCRNRRCVNPGHLEPVSMRENVVVRSTHSGMIIHREGVCKHDHELVPENTRVYQWKNRVFRVCKECNRRRSREWQRAMRARSRLQHTA